MKKYSLSIFAISFLFFTGVAFEVQADEIATTTATSTPILTASSTEVIASSTATSTLDSLSATSTASTTMVSLKAAIKSYNSGIKSAKAAMKKIIDKATAVYNAKIKALKKELTLAKKTRNKYAIAGANKYYKEQAAIAKTNLAAAKLAANNDYLIAKQEILATFKAVEAYWKNPPKPAPVATSTPESSATSTPAISPDASTSTPTTTSASL